MVVDNNSSSNLPPCSPSISAVVKLRIFNFLIFSTTVSRSKPMATYLSTVSGESPYNEMTSTPTVSMKKTWLDNNRETWGENTDFRTCDDR